MARFKLKLLRMNQCILRYVAVSNINRIRDSVCSSYCTMIESAKHDDPMDVTESPELPIWVRISENNTLIPKTPEDDFVLPSISQWIQNYKRSETEIDKTTVSNELEIDAKTISKILMNHFESLDSVVKALNEANVIPSETLVSQMLKRFDNNWKSAYGVFIWAEAHMDSKFSPEMYDLLVDCLGKSKKFEIMRQVVNEMVKIGEKYVTINTITKVIRRLGKSGLHEEAIDFFKKIETFGVKKDISTLNILIDALAKEKNVERANEIYLEFKNEIPPNSHTFNALIHGWSKARKFEKAKNVIEEMNEHGILPDVISYTSLIEAYCYEKDFRKVDEILEEMEQNGCPPNIVTYTIVMHALGKSKEIDEAIKVYEKMKIHNCVLDSSFYSSLIYILSKSGRTKDAREVFDEMPSQGIKRDTRTYNTMITTLCNNEQEEDALNLLHEMETNFVKPDFDTYAPLLKMCCKLKRMKVVSFLLSHMSDHNVSVGIGAYSLLVRGLCKNGKVKQACLFLEDAVLRGFEVYDTMFKVVEMEVEKDGLSDELKRVRELKAINSRVNVV